MKAMLGRRHVQKNESTCDYEARVCFNHTYFHQATDGRFDLKGDSLEVGKEIDERHVACF